MESIPTQMERRLCYLEPQLHQTVSFPMLLIGWFRFIHMRLVLLVPKLDEDVGNPLQRNLRTSNHFLEFDV